MIILFQQTKLWSLVQGIETKPNVRNPTFEPCEEKDLPRQLEIMSHLHDQQADIISDLLALVVCVPLVNLEL